MCHYFLKLTIDFTEKQQKEIHDLMLKYLSVAFVFVWPSVMRKKWGKLGGSTIRITSSSLLGASSENHTHTPEPVLSILL